MKLIWVIVSVLVLTATANAQESRMKLPAIIPKLNQLQIYPLSFEIRYEKDSAENFIEQRPQNLAFAYRTNVWSILFEYSKFTQSSGNATLNIDREHKEMVLWGRWHLWRITQKEIRVSVYGAGGLGTYSEDITTSLSGSSQKDSTGAKMMGGLAAGADISYDFAKNFGAVAAVEGRGLMGQEFDPNPTFGALVRGGLYYSW